LLLTVTAYVGGFPPVQHLRRVDRLTLRANSRHEKSRWQKVLESVMLSLSDQQLVTGLAILIAGYYEMVHNNLSVYHWNIVIYLSWMSSAVHIASLTFLSDVFNRSHTLRNIRVAGMLALSILLVAAMWPLRRLDVPLDTPVKCLWGIRPWNAHIELYDARSVDADRVLSAVMLVGGYIWKLSQLLGSSSGWVRRWLVAKPQAATERRMRTSVENQSSRWLARLAHLLLTYCYIIFVIYAELAESFAAVVIYLSLALPWGTVCIFHYRNLVPDDVRAGESAMTFGQVVPILLLILPVLAGVSSYAQSRGECDIPGTLYEY
jgi:hypothetical protein